jgi:hypothetical protein
METPSPFELNLAIRRWRENLAQSTAFQTENLNELESHLRDSIDRLRTPQLSDEEAFLIATRRIGQTRQLESEFGKLNRNTIWLGRALWMLIGIQVWPIFDRLMSGLASCLFALGWGNVQHSPSAVGDAWPIFFSTLIQLPALVVAIWLTWKVVKNSGKFGQWVARKLPERASFAFCCIGISLLSFLLYGLVFFLSVGWIRLSEHSFHDRASTYVMIWSQDFMGILRIIGFAILTLLLARKQFVPEKRPF